MWFEVGFFFGSTEQWNVNAGMWWIQTLLAFLIFLRFIETHLSMKTKVLYFLMLWFSWRTLRSLLIFPLQIYKFCIKQSTYSITIINNLVLLEQPNDLKYFQELQVKYLSSSQEFLSHMYWSYFIKENC